MARLVLKKTGVKNARDVFRLSVPELMRIDGVGKERAVSLTKFDDWSTVDRIIDKTHRTGSRLLALSDPDYPPLLKQIFDPPIILWVRGNIDTLNKPGIAVVGTRNPGRYGLEQTEKWSAEICENRLSVNSGLAYGVDSKAHKTAVSSGGATVAVLGSGIDRIYPHRNQKLAADIVASGGAVVSEYPPGTKPDAANFPERNRIVSGLSLGTFVIESGIKGGSMITARLALDQNREVFVVPHQLGYLKGEGCNYLIRTGQGKLVQSMDDILEELPMVAQHENGHIDEFRTVQVSKKWEADDSLTETEMDLCRTIGDQSVHIDLIAEKMQTEPFKLSSLLLNLELKGLIQQKAGKYFELK